MRVVRLERRPRQAGPEPDLRGHALQRRRGLERGRHVERAGGEVLRRDLEDQLVVELEHEPRPPAPVARKDFKSSGVASPSCNCWQSSGAFM